MYLRPSEIRSSQDSINNVFDERSNHARVRIGETLDDLVNGYITVNDIPTISIVKRNGDWYTSDNRRLWVFRNSESLGKFRQIPVTEVWSIPFNKVTTDCDGVTIRVRRNPGGSRYSKSSTIVNNSKSDFKQRGNTESNLLQANQNRRNDLFSRLSPTNTNYAVNPQIVDHPSISSTGSSAAVTGSARQPLAVQNVNEAPIPTDNKAVVGCGQNYGHSQASVSTHPGQYAANANSGSAKSGTSVDSLSGRPVSEESGTSVGSLFGGSVSEESGTSDGSLSGRPVSGESGTSVDNLSDGSVSEDRNRLMSSNRGGDVPLGVNSTDNDRHSARVNSSTQDGGLRRYTDNPTFHTVRIQPTNSCTISRTVANRKDISDTLDILEASCGGCVVQ